MKISLTCAILMNFLAATNGFIIAGSNYFNGSYIWCAAIAILSIANLIAIAWLVTQYRKAP